MLLSHLRLSTGHRGDACGRAAATRQRAAETRLRCHAAAARALLPPYMIIVNLRTLNVVRGIVKSAGGEGVSTEAAAGLKLLLAEGGREKTSPARLTVPTETDLTRFGALSQLV